MRSILNSRITLWLLLAIPAMLMVRDLARESADAIDLIPGSGIVSIRLMILAMAIGPLADLAGPGRFSRWIMARRRYAGFAAFLYALGHLALYAVDMGTIGDMLGEITEHGIWTGWAALLLMAVPGLTSTDAAMRVLRRNWKRAQRFAYPAALFSILHWGLLELNWTPALVHIAPLAALNIARFFKRTGA